MATVANTARPLTPYRDCVMHGDDSEVPVIVEGREVGRIAVRDLLP